jgi:hypothetical protein
MSSKYLKIRRKALQKILPKRLSGCSKKLSGIFSKE